MLDSDYYEKYRGPPLVKCVLDNKDITNKMMEFYGKLNNWNGKLYTYKEVFGEDCNNKQYRLDFKSVDGRDHWFHGFIIDSNHYMNPPLATPINQVNK